MLLRQLFEAETKHVTFCFGRMNPPTIGHKQVLDTMKSQGGEMKIFVSQSQDKKKNPLDYATKIKFIKEMFPQYAKDVVENAALNTIGKVASYLHEQGYNAATFVAGSDRLEDMKNLLTQYNGVEGKAHGFYKFDVIDFASSGDREDGAEGVAGVSASGARSAAANNDFEGFQEATGAGELAKPLFAAVRKGMGISENVDEGWKDKLGAAALAGSLAFGAAGANARVLPGADPSINRFTGKPIATQQDTQQDRASDTEKDSGQQKIGFSTEYLKKVADGKHPRPMISVDDAKKELERRLNNGVSEAPIEMDPADPMDPMIHSHDKANPAKLKYRMLRASGQLKDLASRAENASPGEWQIMARQFEELKMNMEQIRHALEELGKLKSKGGIRSRGITV
jgi:hypothetical protein